MSERLSPSGIPVAAVLRPEPQTDAYARDLGDPGRFPFTRGVQPTMYRGRLWTMRQYAGFGTAAATNARFRLLLEAGQTGLSVAFDLPTQMGIDSDSPRALGEVGRVGVAIDTVDDLHVLLDGIPLDRVSTSMTINATASTLLAMYIVVAEERGIPRAALSGTVQNDILKEYIARGTYIYPPAPSLALTAEMFRFCARRCRSGTPSPYRAITFARRGARRCRRWPSPSPTRWSTCGRPWRRGWRWTPLRRGSRSSSRPTATCSRRWPSSAPRADSGRA
jgi:methylmalonyl-CoA mutase N-terminal domain/subunit